MAKVKMTVWVSDSAARAIRELAEARGSTVSQVAARELEKIIEGDAAQVGVGPVVDRVERAVTREVARMTERLSTLLARTALEAAADRRSLFQLMVKEFGEEKARSIMQSSWTAAVASLRKPAEAIREILAANPSEN
jgi:nucleotide-binding universal stress UspA family protein